MTKLYITEFSGLQDAMAHPGQSAPVAMLPSAATQNLTPGGASLQSAVLAASTKLVRLHAVVACHVLTGSNPTATTAGLFLAAGSTEYFGVRPGDKIAVIAA